MKKITFTALCVALLMCSCSDTGSSVSTNTSVNTTPPSTRTPEPADDTPDFINMHEFQLYQTSIRYNGISHPTEGYLIDEASYVFRLDDVANYFGLDVAFDESGAISINGNLDIKSADYIPALDLNQISIDDRYTMAGIMNLSTNGSAVIEYETDTSANNTASDSGPTVNTYSNNNSGYTASNQPNDRYTTDAAANLSKDNSAAAGSDDPKAFKFSSPSDVGEIEANEKNEDQILADFALYHEVASRFYSRFYEVPNLTWAEHSASVIQVLNHPDSASYWYYVPNELKDNLQDEYVTILSSFGYEYAGSSNGYHTYTLNSNSVSFGFEGSDFIVKMSGLAKCRVGEEYENGFKNAGLADFGKKFNIACNEELMYYGDWVYSYPLENVNRANAIYLYLNELERNKFTYIGTSDGKSSYSDGNVTIGMRTLDDNFYLSIIKE